MLEQALVIEEQLRKALAENPSLLGEQNQQFLDKLVDFTNNFHDVYLMMMMMMMMLLLLLLLMMMMMMMMMMTTTTTTLVVFNVANNYKKQCKIEID